MHPLGEHFLVLTEGNSHRLQWWGPTGPTKNGLDFLDFLDFFYNVFSFLDVSKSVPIFQCLGINLDLIYLFANILMCPKREIFKENIYDVKKLGHEQHLECETIGSEECL